jgi:asparagine synthase (glutamine-hydrolysing)
MCGLVGLINLNGELVEHKLLKKMTDSIAHRGPDGEGFLIEQNVALGHRRLSIIDLTSTGDQPMRTPEGRFALIYNGEIYNFRELRVELQSLGYKFKGSSDSEVVLYSLTEWKEKAFLKFNGMFVIAFLDLHEKTLLLGRDRYGIKPLYYAKQNNRFYFASEQKAILSDTSFRRDINKKALLEYFTFQNIFTNQTLMKDIFLLPAGHWMKINFASDYKEIINQYWDFHFREPDRPASKNEYIEELERLFQQAVNRQLVSDVEIGAYLSGGMDSGSITAIASKNIDNLKSFTCGFDLSSAAGLELAFDERAKAEAMSAYLKTEHYEIILKAGDMERSLPAITWHLEEPRVGQSYPNYYVAKLASKFVKVVLSGAGGDELFAGYPWRYYRTSLSQNFDQYIDNYYLYWQRLVSNVELKQLFAPIWEEVNDVWTLNIFKEVFKNHPNELKSPADYVNHSLYFEAKTFLQGILLVEDKLSMAFGLETRLPFLDNDLVDFAQQIPLKYKLSGFQESQSVDENSLLKKKRKLSQISAGKQIFRETMEKIIPTEVTKFKKQGFSSPDASWFKAESLIFLQNKFKKSNNVIFEFTDYNVFKRKLDEHVNGVKNNRLFIWSYIYLDSYLENIMSDEII